MLVCAGAPLETKYPIGQAAEPALPGLFLIDGAADFAPQSMNQEKGAIAPAAIGFHKLLDLSGKYSAGNNKIQLPSEVGPETVAISGFQRLKL